MSRILCHLQGIHISKRYTYIFTGISMISDILLQVLAVAAQCCCERIHLQARNNDYSIVLWTMSLQELTQLSAFTLDLFSFTFYFQFLYLTSSRKGLGGRRRELFRHLMGRTSKIFEQNNKYGHEHAALLRFHNDFVPESLKSVLYSRFLGFREIRRGLRRARDVRPNCGE